MTWHIEELLEHCHLAPAVNQVEYSPFLQMADLHELCRRHGIRIEAYSPLTKGQRLDDPVVGAVAAECGKTTAQVLIRWALQHDLVVIPKSERPERIAENADVFDFELTDDQMGRLDALDEGFRTSWDPSTAP
jgi:diketogulonate reductase-like aldo/keto reductase